MPEQLSQRNRLRLALLVRIGSLSVGPRIRQGYVSQQLSRYNLAGKRILDAGCGDGTYTWMLASRFPRISIIGIDYDKTRVARAIQSCRYQGGAFRGEFKVGSITQPLEEIFDIIYCVDVLEHISEDTTVIRNFREALRSEGILIIHVPLSKQRRYFPWLKEWAQEDHVRDGYEKESLYQMIEHSGFTVLESRYTFGPMGALAWDIEETCRTINKYLRFTFVPLLLLLTEIELRWPNQQGNSVLITAQKS